MPLFHREIDNGGRKGEGGGTNKFDPTSGKPFPPRLDVFEPWHQNGQVRKTAELMYCSVCCARALAHVHRAVHAHDPQANATPTKPRTQSEKPCCVWVGVKGEGFKEAHDRYFVDTRAGPKKQRPTKRKSGQRCAFSISRGISGELRTRESPRKSLGRFRPPQANEGGQGPPLTNPNFSIV